MWGRYMGDFGLVYSDCCLTARVKLVLIKMVEYSVFVMLILGVFLPSRLLLLHSVLCLLLIVNLDAEWISLRKYTYLTMKENTKRVTKKEMGELSNTVSMSASNCKKILIIMMAISIIGCLYPDYSVKSMMERLNDCKI